MEVHDLLYEDPLDHKYYLTGLARQCPECGLIAHYTIAGRTKEFSVNCVECDYEFSVKKYQKGERPKYSKQVDKTAEM